MTPRQRLVLATGVVTGVVVTLGAGSPAASDAQPPAMVLNDIVVIDDVLYGTNELSRELVAVDLSSRAPRSD